MANADPEENSQGHLWRDSGAPLLALICDWICYGEPGSTEILEGLDHLQVCPTPGETLLPYNHSHT